MTPHFYFVKSWNNNTVTYQLPLDQAREIYTQIWDNPKTTLQLIKSGGKHDQVNVRFFNALKRKSKPAHTTWGSRIAFIYNFGSNIKFTDWVDFYTNAILPNYDPKHWHELTELREDYHPTSRTYTIYDELEDLAVTHNGIRLDVYSSQANAELRRQLVRTSKQHLINSILHYYPTPHIQYALDHYLDLFVRNDPTRDPRDNTIIGRVQLTNTHYTHELNGIIETLLNNPHNIYASIFERLDIIDPRIIDHYSGLIGYEIPTHDGTKRTITIAYTRQ